VNGTSDADCKQQPGVMAPVISLARCEGKGECVKVCPENVFSVARIEQQHYRDLNIIQKIKLRVHGMQVAYTPRADACRSCGLCVSACPEQAITLSRRVAGL
jgi:ferredoxin